MADTETIRCRWCGEAEHRDDGHPMAWCPLIRALEFGAGGAVTRVEFLTPADCGVRTATAETAEPQPEYRKFPSA